MQQAARLLRVLRPDGLEGPQLAELDAAVTALGRELRCRLEGAAAHLLLGVCEDEHELLSQPTPESELKSPTLLLDTTAEPVTTTVAEEARDAVQHFFLLRGLLREWAKGEREGLDPIASVFEGPSLTIGTELELVGGQALSALCAAGMTKIQVSFVVDMDYVLLCQPTEKEKAGVHVVRLVTSLRHQEAFINQHHNCVLHIILRSTTKPHAACRRLKIASTSTSPRDKPLWNLTLLFPTREQCAAAHTHLETSRVRSAISHGLRVYAACIQLFVFLCIVTPMITNITQARLRPRTVAALLQHLPADADADVEKGQSSSPAGTISLPAESESPATLST
jgi:hypothetical protein